MPPPGGSPPFDAALSSPLAKLREKVRRRFEEIENTRRTRPGPGNPHERKLLDDMSHDLELSNKSQFLLEELVALPPSSDAALRGLLTREIDVLSQQKRQIRDRRKAEQEIEMAKLRDLFSRGTPT